MKDPSHGVSGTGVRQPKKNILRTVKLQVSAVKKQKAQGLVSMSQMSCCQITSRCALACLSDKEPVSI